jgi:hypothetical protein
MRAGGIAGIVFVALTALWAVVLLGTNLPVYNDSDAVTVSLLMLRRATPRSQPARAAGPAR